MTPLIAWNVWVQWLKAHMLICPSVKYWNMQCPGCGMQRSMIALLEGDLFSSLQLYPALIPLITLFTYTLLHLKYNFTGAAKNITVMQVAVVSIITAHYIYKIYTHQIFL